jgi:two-component system, OmpR family, response regulator MprA
VSLRPPPRILVVDDDASVRELMRRYLRRRGCLVDVAPDGAEALDRVARAAFDAIVTDIEMPRVNGAELWRRVVALHPPMRDRFVFCTSQPLPASMPRDHASRFLSKPFDLAELWAKLANVMTDPSPAASVEPD